MRKAKVKFCIWSILLLISYKGLAQDIHFSQFYNSPLSLNPAMTGMMRQDYRVVAIYRNQWRQIPATFITSALSADMNFLVNKENSDKMGLGFFLMSDHIGDGIIKNNSAFLSWSYHKIIDRKKRHKLSLGMQTGYVQKQLDYSSLWFGDQVNNFQYDPSMQSSEPMGRTVFSYVNFNTGLNWNFKLDENTDLHSGVSFFNLNSPRESFVQQAFEADLNRLRNRFIWSGGMVYKLNEQYSLMPEILVMRQTRAMDMNIGSAIGYNLSSGRGNMIQGGLWYRLGDAIIFMAGMNYKNYKAVFTYDATVSGMNKVKRSPTVKDNAKIGAYEITLTYAGFLNRALPHKHTIPCGFF